jgi:hypothetical protein
VRSGESTEKSIAVIKKLFKTLDNWPLHLYYEKSLCETNPLQSNGSRDAEYGFRKTAPAASLPQNGDPENIGAFSSLTTELSKPRQSKF